MTHLIIFFERIYAIHVQKFYAMNVLANLNEHYPY